MVINNESGTFLHSIIYSSCITVEEFADGIKFYIGIV